jgi:hypothetical protein
VPPQDDTDVQDVTPDEIGRTIQLILAPAVMITACSITMGGLFSHYEAVSARLRMMARERLDLLRKVPEGDELAPERLAEIDHQVPDLLRRHDLVRNALVAIESSVALFVACMLTIAAATVSGATVIASVVLALFLLGTLLLLIGVLISAVEIGVSHRALAFEVRRVLDLKPTDRRR